MHGETIKKFNKSCVHLLKICYHKTFWNPYTSSQFRAFAFTLLLVVENKKRSWGCHFSDSNVHTNFRQIGHLKQKFK